MIRIDLPHTVEQRLRSAFPDLDAAAREAAVVELYRQDQISHHEVGLSLQLSRFEVDELLKRHGVTEDMPSLAEYDADLAEAKKLLGR